MLMTCALQRTLSKRTIFSLLISSAFRVGGCFPLLSCVGGPRRTQRSQGVPAMVLWCFSFCAVGYLSSCNIFQGSS